MIFIIKNKTISDIIRNQEHTNHAGYYFYLSEHYQMERAGWMKKGCFFSLSYEQLTRFAERRIRECNLDSQGAIYLCESAKAGAVLIFWHELAINGYASMNAIKRQELIDADFQRLSETSSGRRMTGNDPEPPTVATAAESADCAGCP
uniref:Uncharacterized protein n=1 Tax=Escherichia coli TaxID=562 RepID=A0A6D1P210_ECOLX|nr:hypothetical protein AFAJKIAJ_00177 [Escherichia coli]